MIIGGEYFGFLLPRPFLPVLSGLLRIWGLVWDEWNSQFASGSALLLRNCIELHHIGSWRIWAWQVGIPWVSVLDIDR